MTLGRVGTCRARQPASTLWTCNSARVRRACAVAHREYLSSRWHVRAVQAFLRRAARARCRRAGGRRRAGRARLRGVDARERRDPPRCGDRSRHRVVSERALGRIQDRRRDRPAILSQFHPLEAALTALGVIVWPMVEFEADDGLASAAARAASDPQVEQVFICTPDKDLAQCVTGDRVVQFDRRAGVVRDAAGVKAKFGVPPSQSPITWRWLETPPTATPACRAGVPSQPPLC